MGGRVFVGMDCEWAEDVTPALIQMSCNGKVFVLDSLFPSTSHTPPPALPRTPHVSAVDEAVAAHECVAAVAASAPTHSPLPALAQVSAVDTSVAAHECVAAVDTSVAAHEYVATAVRSTQAPVSNPPSVGSRGGEDGGEGVRGDGL